MQPTTAAPTDLAGANQNQQTADMSPDPIPAIDFGTTAQLFDEIRAFLGQHPGLTADAALKLTYFVFAILFPECAQMWPFASVVAPDTAGSSLLLRMLACVCVAPLHIGNATLSALLTLPSSPRPSPLIIDQLVPNWRAGASVADDESARRPHFAQRKILRSFLADAGLHGRAITRPLDPAIRRCRSC